VKSVRKISREDTLSQSGAARSASKGEEVMSIWGKLAGAVGGLSEDAHMSGPVRGLLGALAGGHISRHDNDSSAQHQVAFTIGVIALGAVKSDPYEVLGIAPDIDDDTLKSHYRKLVLDNHPDKMIARGVPPEFVSLATKKVAAINAAYAELAKERRI